MRQAAGNGEDFCCGSSSFWEVKEAEEELLKVEKAKAKDHKVSAGNCPAPRPRRPSGLL